ncbi:MAG: ATP-binding cassette domain-containing protein [Gammaproteobacteria bacterium]|jgi:putative ABC transport system ATP-binding protein
MTDENVLKAENLVKTFGAGHTEVRAVDDVSLEVRRGELVLVMGPSGSGKTTLLSMLGGLLRPTSGRVYIDGVETTVLDESKLPPIRARSIGFVFQAFNLLDALTVSENILFPARLVSRDASDAAARCGRLMERLRLSSLRNRLPRTLSGGEKQRVAIARALINAPPLILADEPTGNLDSVNGQEVMMILYDVARDEGRSVVLVTHDPRVEDVADRILWLEDGALRDRKKEPHAWVRDPVCGMRIDAWTAEIEREHGGERYVFCSHRCLERFDADPQRYAREAAERAPS